MIFGRHYARSFAVFRDRAAAEKWLGLSAEGDATL